MQSPRVLMLDFDGVLHPGQGSKVREFYYADRLAETLDGSDCSIVISSTWREHFPVTRLRALLPQDLARRVVDVLGPDHLGPHVRYKNILTWVRNQNASIDWRALDDSAVDFPLGCPQLILCNGSIGLDKPQECALRTWLKDSPAAC